jgi:Secretion system C-terminal sorting domain
MKTKFTSLFRLNYLVLVFSLLKISFASDAQTYTSVKNGSWNNASTWQDGIVPPVDGNITSTMIINIKHRVSYSAASINNQGIITVANLDGPSPRLSVVSGVSITNNVGGKIYIENAEYRQYRFIGGGQTGIAQTGSLINAGGFVEVKNSYVEVAENFINQNMGVRVVNNASISTGKGFKLTSNSFDTLKYSSFSVGMHGTGDFTINSGTIYFQSVRVQVASPAGLFKINGSTANGDIDYITLKNHVTNLTGAGTITVSNSVNTNGLNLDAYCAASPAFYIPNGKVSGTQTPNCSLNLFPARLFASAASSSMNMTDAPLLVSGIDLQTGAKYQYESIAPGIDAFVTIDSLVNGATINMLDDNVNGSGFTEGFQPQITSGAVIGESYVKLKFEYFVSGTNQPATVSDLTLTALDIDGTSTYKEFDEIGLGSGATASYVIGTPAIALTQPEPGTFRGINADGITVNGIDTSAKQYMFSVHNTDVSTFTVKMGLVNTQAIATYRLFSFYSKAFVYPINQTLPVKLESFTTSLSNDAKNTILRWTTAGETSLSHFVIERSTDGINFTDAGVVFAYGNATNKTNYSFSDNVSNIQNGVVYYRLRSVDNDGGGRYSETRIVRISKQDNNDITIIAFPNPVINELRVTIPSSWQSKKVTYEIFNVNGQFAKKTENANSNQTETLNVNSLASGFYIVKVTCNGETAQQKIIKQ